MLAGQPPSTGYLVWHLSLRWRAALDQALTPLGLTSSQYGVLASLSGLSSGGSRPSQRQLSEFTGLRPMHVSKLIRGLERAGLVERDSNPSDTRAVQLSVTVRGAEVVASARGIVSSMEEQRLAPLGGAHSKHSNELRMTLLMLLRHAEEIELSSPEPEGDQSTAESRPAPVAAVTDQKEEP